MADLLRLAHVSRRFSGFALEDVSFSLPEGYIMGLVGPNGSGKTTTIKIIMNMVARDAGSTAVDGLDSVRDEAEVKKRIGYVSDELIFMEDWKTADVANGLSIYFETFDRAAFETYLRRFELPAGKKIKTFSRGMKTRLMLAAALSRQTRLLVLDEPTSGLDPVIRSELLDILQEYIADGAHSVLFSTHITADLEKVADYVTFLHKGKLVFSRSMEDLLETYRLVKGGEEDLSDSLRKSLVGLRRGRLGFEGLALAQRLPHPLPAGMLCERPSLDDIIVYHTRGVEK